MVGKLFGRLGSRCRGLPGERGRHSHIQAGKGMDILGALNTDWDVSLWQGSIFGGAQRPHHFPDDSYRPSRIQGPERVRKIKSWEPEATRWAHFGGVCQGAKGRWCQGPQQKSNSVYPRPSLPDVEGRKGGGRPLSLAPHWLQSATWTPLCMVTF